MTMSKMFPINGVMIDMVRLTERLEYYQRLIDQCADWGLNAILLHFTDDQGCAMKFESHPKLASRYALSKNQMAELVARADRRGVTLIPEIESFGHTSYVTERAGYRHLADGPGGRFGFTAICPLHRETLALFGDLYREAAEVFSTSPYIHIGCDEVNFGHSVHSRKLLDRMPRHAVFGQYVAALVKLVRRTGKEAIIWGDHLLHDERIAEYIDRKVIVHDWRYDPPLPPGQVTAVAKMGYRVIGGPGLMWYNYRLRCPTAAWEVLDEYIKRLGRLAADQRLGMINTVWVPTRYTSGAMWPALAVHAKRMAGKTRGKALREFVAEFWGVRSAELAQAVDRADRLAPSCSFMKLLWTNPSELAEAIWNFEPYSRQAEPIEALLKVFKSHRPRVRSNRDDYDSYVLTLEIQAHGIRRTADVIAALSASARRAETILQRIADSDRRLLDRVYDDWAAARHPDDPRKTAEDAKLEIDQMIAPTMTEAAKFSKRLPALWPKLKDDLKTRA